MKKYRIILAAFTAALTLGLAGGCTNTNLEEVKDLVLTRCLQPMNLSAKISQGQNVTFSWDVTKDVDSYNLEVYTDEAMMTLAFSETVEPGNVPVTKYLDVDQTYWFRVQAHSKARDDSKWAVYGKSIKTYAVKSCLYMKVAERAAESLTLSWNADPEVDRIEYLASGEEEYSVYTLTPDDIEAGKATVPGLTPSTEYDVILYFSSANRGEVNVWTMPDPSVLTPVSNDAQLAQAISDGAGILVKMEGSPYTLNSAALESGLDVSKGFKLYGEGAADGTMPVIYGTVSVADNYDGGALYFEGIEFNGKSNTCGFVFQKKNGGSASDLPIESVIFKNCIITGYSKGLLYEWGKTMNIGEFTFDSCEIHEVNGDGSGGGDGFDLRNATTISKVKFVNNTIYNGFRTFLRVDATPVLGDVIFENNTVMNLSFVDNTNNAGLIGFQAAPTSFSLKNNLFLNMVDKAVMTSSNAKYLSGDNLNLSAENNWFYNIVETFFTDNFTLAMASGKMLSADPCYNAKGGMFNILSSSEIAGKKVGASKWWVEYIEEPEDLTLETLDGPHTWNFADPKLFSGDVTKSKVRDQLLFSVTDNKITYSDDATFNFTAAAVTTKKGVPTDGYIAFKVDKPGSVIIKPVDDESLGNHLVIGAGVPGGSTLSIKGGASPLVDMTNPQKILVKGITEETMIYIYPSGPVGLESLAWSADTASVNTALPAPKPSVKPATVTAGDAEDVTVSWEAVENAASYTVVFGGKSYEVEDGESYTIAASVIGMLDAGSYAVSVYANPGKNDIYNTMSDAGTAAFAVQPKGGDTPTDIPVVSSVEDLLTAISAGKQAIALKYSETPYEIGALTLTAPLKLYGQTSGDKKTPVKMNVILSGDIKEAGTKASYGGVGSIFLNNLDITNDGASVISESKDNVPLVDTVGIIDCNIHGTKALYDNSGKAASDVQVLVIKGNLIEGCSNASDFIDLRNGAHHKVTIVNNTFANSCRTFIRTDPGHELNYLTVRNNTFYKVATNSSSKDNNGIFHVRSAAGSGLLEYKVQNNIFYSILIDETPSNPNGFPKFRSGSGISPATIVNNWFYNCEDREEKADYSFWKNLDKEAATKGGGAILPADPFKDAENGDYTLTNGVVMNANAGDPRWNPMRGSVPTSEITVKNTDEFLTAISAGKTAITLASGDYDLTGVEPSVTEVANGKLTLTSSVNLIGESGAHFIGGFIFNTGVTAFSAKGIDFDGNSAIDNVFYVSEGAEMKSLSIRNSTIKNYKNRLFYMDKVATVGSVEFNSDIITGTDGADFTSGDFIDIRKGTVNAIRMENCTVANAVRTFARIDAAVVLSSMLVANNTFYNMCFVDSKDNNGIFHVRSTGIEEQNYIVRNNIFAGMHRASDTPSQANGYPKLVATSTASKIPTFSHNYFNDIDTLSTGYNFWTKDRVTEEIATAGYGIVLSETPFKNAAEGDFTLVNALAASEKVGDQRWNPNAGKYTGVPFEVESTEDLLVAISAGKTDLLLTGDKYDFISSSDESFTGGVLSVATDLRLTGKIFHGVKPVLNGGFKLLATEGSFVLDKIHLVGTGKSAESTDVTVGNMIDIDATAILGGITIKNCDIEKFGNRLISGSGTSTCGPVVVSGNTVNEFGTGGDFIDFRKGTVSSFKIVNNTFSNGIRTFLRVDAAVTCGAVNVENNTFYNLCSVDSKDNNGIMHVRSTSATADNRQIIVKKNIFAAMHKASDTPSQANGFPKLVSTASGKIAFPTITDNIFFDIDTTSPYSWWNTIPEENTAARETTVEETPFANDPATTGKFTVKTAYKGYGDLRW